MKRFLVTFLLLFSAWLAWSGYFDKPLLLWGGLLSALGIVLLTRRLGILDEESHPYQLSWRPLLYLPWLSWQMLIANFRVAWLIVLTSLGKKVLSPQLVRVRASQKTDVGRVGFANSVTLTPGTVTLHVKDGSLLAHSLTRKMAEELESGEMDRRARWLEGSSRVEADETEEGASR
ncbi:MAG: Na+/H+ antiporter subunit E [Acidobacteriota bacterium]